MVREPDPERSEGFPEHSDGATRSEISGSAGQAVQAREVHGGVHFHSQDSAPGPVPRQLPGDVHGFVNRIAELERLGTLFSDEAESGHREFAVYVIVGTAGAGKTALALHWAHQVRDRFPDGQLYANLRGYDPGLPASPEQVLERFLQALDVPRSSIPADLDSRAALFRSVLADRRVLVILDNAATVKQVRPLLPGGPDCLVLITSRSRLSGLIARDGAQRLTVGTLESSEAIALLETVTAPYRHRDDDAEIAELARLCARLPLALRIAAERAASNPHMPLSQLIQDLRDESRLWDALAADDDDEEADAVRSVFAWSYRALPEPAARLFRLLGIHPGPEFTPRAAAALADTTTRHVRHQLDVLTGAHLLEPSGPDRYQFHDLLRAYAIDQGQHEETPDSRRAILRRVLTWYLYTTHAAAAAIDSQLRPVALPPHDSDLIPQFADHHEAVSWYEAERDNLTAAIHAAASAGLHDLAWQLPAVLRHIYAFYTPPEWLSTGLIGLAAARHVGARSGEADLLESLGMAYVQHQQTEQGIAHHQEALAIRRELGDEFGQATILNGIGLAHLRNRQLTDARACFDQCLTIVRRLGEQRWEGIALGNLADTALDHGDLQHAIDVAHQAIAIHRTTGNQVSEFACLTTLSAVHRKQDRLNDARHHIQHALDIAQELDNQVREAYALLELGMIQADSELLEDALVSYHRAAVLHRRIGDNGREAEAFHGTGNVFRKLGRLDEAIEFYQQAVAGHRKQETQWQLAATLGHLADALDSAGDQDAATRHRQEAFEILANFSDRQATNLRNALFQQIRQSQDR